MAKTFMGLPPTKRRRGVSALGEQIVYAIGTTLNIETTSAVIMPPTIGAAMRRMTSDPVPLLHMIGGKPAMTTEAVIMIGRTRSAAPSTMASVSPCRSGEGPGGRTRVDRRVDVDEHDDADLRRDAGERDEAHGRRDRHVVTQQIHEPQTTDQRERQRGDDDQRIACTAEHYDEQYEYGGEHGGTTIFRRSCATSRYSYWPDQETNKPAAR
jgi:hypothetical protein